MKSNSRTVQHTLSGAQRPFARKNKRLIFSYMLGAVLSASALVMSSCQSAEVEQGPLRTVLRGEISNPAGNNASIRIADSVYRTELDAQGNFVLHLDLEQAGYARFRIGPEYGMVYLRPGDSLNLTLDATAFDESLSFTGSAASINNYLAGRMLRQISLSEQEDLYLLGEEEFRQHSQQHHRESLEGLSGASLDDDEFNRHEKIELDFGYADRLATYPLAHGYLSGKTEFKTTEAFWNFVDELDMNNPDNARSETFLAFASRYLGHMAQNQPFAPEESADYALYQMNLIEEVFSEKQVRAALSASVLTEYLSYRGPNGAEPLYERYMKMAPEGAERDKVEKQYRGWQELAQGKPAPDFSGYTLDGELVKLSDLKGKTVYVDVWATWCGPCLRELPYLETLQDAYAGREDVVLMSISVDDDQKAWEDMLQRDEPGGLQIHAREAWNAEVVENYRINGIPRFLLIDAEGLIADAHAPRPSSGEVEALLP